VPSTTFGGDVSGTYNAIVVANDSHTHTFNNLTAKAAGTGDYATTGDIQSGKGSGGVALTINDGGGNANVTFNHKDRTPEQNGQAARIEVNTDNTSSGNAHMYFELGGATSGVISTLPTIFELSESDVIARRDFEVVGDITVSGTVDGRDVATDGTKLDGIESGATADQTASEILTAIKTVDGASSGLDADLLDGQEGSYYTNAANLTGTIPDVFNVGTRYNIGLIDGSSSNTRDKLRVWTGGSYTIGMQSAYTFGALGDYAMTFQMNDDSDRGFWWGDAGHTKAQGAMSLTTNGHLAVANTVKIGYGESNTSGAAYDLDVSGNGHFTGSIHVGAYIYHDGDTNSYLRFVAADDVQLVSGGRQMIRMDEGTDPDRLQFVTSSNWTDSNGDWNMTGNVSIGGTLTVGGSAVGGGPTHSATASGAIANGDPCVVNSDGTVSAIAESSVSLGATTPAAIGSGYMGYVAMATDSNGTILVVYSDSNNYLGAVVGEDQGDGTVSWGTAVTLLSQSCNYIELGYIPNEDCFITVYRNSSVSNRHYAGKITVSGTTPTFTVGGYQTAGLIQTSLCENPDLNTLIIVGEYNASRLYGMHARIANGNAVLGGLTTLYNSSIDAPAIAYDTSLQKAVCVYRQSYAKAVMITQDASTLALTAGGTTNTVSHMESGSFKLVYAPGDNLILASNNAGKACLVYWTNTGNDTWMSQLDVTSSAVTSDGSREINLNRTWDGTCVYDSNTDTFLVVYEHAGNYVHGRVATVGTTSNGFDVSSEHLIASMAVFNPNKVSGIFSTVSNRGLFVAGDSTTSVQGEYYFFNNAFSATNLNDENFIGISDGAYADAATATIQIVGSVDDAQSGLTAGKRYYVQTDGSLSRTADSPSVIAGTALSATEIIVKG